MFQNRCPFLYNSSAFLLSFLCIVWISFYPGTSSLEPFSLFYDLIASYYTKGKWQWRQGYLFCFESYHFDKKMFLYICLFSSFWSKSWLNQKLSSLKAKVRFCDWQINVWIFSNVTRLQLSPNRWRIQQKYELGTRLTYFWHKNEKKISLNFIFVFKTLRFRHICLLKICFTNKVNLWWGSVASHRVPLPGPQGPGCQDPMSQGCKSQGPGSQFQSPRVTSLRVSGPGSQSLGFQGPGSQVLILDFLIE